MQLSKLENKAYEELKKNNLLVFSMNDLKRILEIDKTKSYNLIKALKKKKAIKKLIKGYFALRDANELAIATRINFPSYISFWTALNYYGLSDQNPKKIFVATTKYARETENFKYVTISRKRFFGYIKIGEIVIADKEKTIIDSLLFPKYSGGIKEIERSMKNAIKNLNLKKLIEYSLKIESKAVLRRLGFLLETIGKKKYLEKIKKNIGKGYELLDPSLKKKNDLNNKWLLDINI